MEIEVRLSYHADPRLHERPSRSSRSVAPPLGIRPGDPLDASIEDGSIVLRPHRKHRLEPRIIKDPILGTPVLSFGPDAPILTSKQVEEILADFP